MAETGFGGDLKTALGLSQRICHIHIQRWRPLKIEKMSTWQDQAIEGLMNEDAISEIERAWRVMVEDPKASKYARLLHEELRAVIEVQESAVFLYDKKEGGGVNEVEQRAAYGRFYIFAALKRAAGAMKTFLDSLKDILEEVLGSWAKIAIQLVIEALELATK